MVSKDTRFHPHRKGNFCRGRGRHVLSNKWLKAFVQHCRCLIDAPVHTHPQLGTLKLDRVECQVRLPVIKIVAALRERLIAVKLQMCAMFSSSTQVASSTHALLHTMQKPLLFLIGLH